MNRKTAIRLMIITITFIIVIVIMVLNIVNQSLGISLGVITAIANFAILIFERTQGFYSLVKMVKGQGAEQTSQSVPRTGKQTRLTKRQYLEEKIQGFEDSQRNSFIPPSYSTDSVVVSKVRHGRTFTTIYDMYNEITQFVLVGYPGVGKTVVMKELFKEIALLHLSEDQSEPMPLWIELNEVTNPIDANELFGYWCNHFYKLNMDFEQQVRTRPPVIFLDGLNEMPLETRTERAASLRNWLTNHKDVKVIISCRTRDYEDDKALSMGEYFSVVRVQPFERDQIYSFLEHIVPKQAKGLMKRIDEDDALFQIARIPLHLSMFAVLSDIYSYRQLPNRLLDLYDEYLEQRYIREVEEKGHINYSWQDLTRRLRKLAYRMAGSLSISTHVARRAMGKKALSDAFNLNLLTRTRDNNVKNRFGLSSSLDTIRFYHQSLHGYFTLPQLLKEIRQIEFLTKSKFIPSFLIRLVMSRNPSAIIRQIGDLGDTAELAVETLSELLDSENKEIATAARSALIDIGVPSVNAMIRIIENNMETLYIHRNKINDLRTIITKEELALKTAYNDIQKRERQLQDKKNRNASDVLKRVKENHEIEVKQLKQKKDDLENLEKLYEDAKNEPLILNARFVLSGIGSTSVAPILLFAFKMASPIVDEQAGDIFQKMTVGERPSVNVINAVRRRGANLEEFKMYMSEALGQISSSRAIEPLLPLLNDDNWEVRTEVIVALTKINQRTNISSSIIDPIIDVLKFETERLPQTYAALLLKASGHDAVRALLHVISRAKASERALLEQALFIVLNKNQALFDTVVRKLRNKTDIDEIMSTLGEK